MSFSASYTEQQENIWFMGGDDSHEPHSMSTPKQRSQNLIDVILFIMWGENRNGLCLSVRPVSIT